MLQVSVACDALVSFIVFQGIARKEKILFDNSFLTKQEHLSV